MKDLIIELRDTVLSEPKQNYDKCFRAADALEQQAVVIEQMREAIGELLCTGEFPTVSFLQAEEALALQPCPEVLNKVRADAVSNAIDAWMCSSAYVNEECIELWFMNYAQRLAKGGS